MCVRLRETGLNVVIVWVGMGVLDYPSSVQRISRCKRMAEDVHPYPNTCNSFLNLTRMRLAAQPFRFLCDEDRELNEQALIEGSRILSVYKLNEDDTVWVITEADRSSTCVLCPNEY